MARASKREAAAWNKAVIAGWERRGVIKGLRMAERITLKPRFIYWSDVLDEIRRRRRKLEAQGRRDAAR